MIVKDRIEILENLKIAATARYIPERVVSNNELSTIMDTSDEWIYPRTGIHNRHVVTDENTSDLATHVAQRLLEKSGWSADELDFIIVSTMSPDSLSPHTAAIVQGNIKASKAFAFDLNAACSGFVYGLSAASALLSSGRYRKGMFIGAEVLSKLVDWKDRTVSVLFGDGAGGVLLEQTNESVGLIAEELQSYGEMGNAILTGRFANQNAFSGEISPLDPYFHQDGRSVYGFATREVPKIMNKALDKAGLAADDIDLYLAHQANERIIRSMAKNFGQDLAKFPTNMAEYGNTSAGSTAILLDELVESGQVHPGMKIAFVGFGGGLAIGVQIWQL
ncbi:3-oxoacyl-[acyl-carrier-protein] synthase-3 [Leuconostocaceae bacterium R-53105]|uniref:Beta-ketoacyl-[acyl-carrier-protein] synthase III n=1 Tax=Convivina intestini TaxID=1505726 RepID=A0A2U1D7R6_9LACO|nr:3-oxoacyl-[acyl-carrier-protein] synthase III [Convivina intestini]CAH1855090.1 3-oxoacyl-[acyl-carrier-protein] synthase 3 [Convivina intestini]SDB92381.1 3-oxoacyl-[acyl-carrier-protein] synthase-3 [Leuconostocaceae bacterium R-53105]